MANKPEDKTVEVEIENPDLRKSEVPSRPGRLDRPQKQRPYNRLLKPNGRTGSYETK